jgi:hypothetical protein
MKYAILVAAVLLGAIPAFGCRTVTPAMRAGGAFLQSDYTRYVNADPVLNEAQRGERVEVVCNHNRLLGNDVPPYCPPTPEAK